MSKIALSGNASGSGTLTISAPNTSTDYTLTLPAETGTMLTSGGAIDVNASAPADSLAIDASGNVGIGTSSPIFSTGGGIEVSHASSANLRLNSDVGGAAEIRHGTSLVIETRTSEPLILGTNSTERLRIDTSGNVGIGTSSPEAKTSIVSAAGAIGLTVKDANAGASNYFSVQYNGTTGVADVKAQSSSGSTTLVFSTSSSGTTAERARIDSSGNVGIGTSSPSSFYSLADNLVVGTGSGGNGITIYSGSADSGYIGFNDTASAGMQGFIQYNHSGDYMAFAPNGSEKARIDSSGNLLVGTAGAVGKLTVKDAADRGQSTAQFSIEGNGYGAFHFLDSVAYSIGQNSNARNLKMYSGGNSGTGVQLAAGGTSWGTYSDERMKDIIEPISDGLNKVLTLRTVIGKYKTDDADKRRSMMIAQDVQAVLPEATTEDADGMLSLAYTDLIPLLTAAIKEQQALIQAQQATIDSLETRIAALEAA